MVTPAKIFLSVICAVIFSILQAAEKKLTVINTGGPDIPFREILIEKSLLKDNFSCTIVQDDFESALKKLSDGQADIVLVKKTPSEIIGLPPEMMSFQYASTPLLVAVNKRNPLQKMKISELQKIWNEDYSHWSVFDEKNIFSIQRFGMRLDDSSFIFLKNLLKLKKDAAHFPLETSQQLITMTAANPNAVCIFVYENNLNLNNVKLIQITDDSGNNIKLLMPHSAVFLKKNKQQIEMFLKVKKSK